MIDSAASVLSNDLPLSDPIRSSTIQDTARDARTGHSSSGTHSMWEVAVQVFKHEPTQEEMHAGVVRVHLPLAVTAACHLALALAALHAAGLSHGEVTDATALVGAECWPPGPAFSAWLSAPPIGHLPPRLHPDALCGLRPDYALFFAPERFDEAGHLVAASASAAADVWGVGVLIAYLLHLSLPLLSQGPLVRRRRPCLVRVACLLCLYRSWL